MKNYHAIFKAIFDAILKKFENDNFDSEGTIFRHASYVKNKYDKPSHTYVANSAIKNYFFEHYLIVCE